jgi:flagellin
MIGAFSSSLALAQRTATKARETMDTMSRQIATGQKVSSVKDDGAAWTRAAALKSEKVLWQDRSFALDRADAGLAYTKLAVERTFVVGEELRTILMEARTYAAGSTARQQLQAQWNAAISISSSANDGNPVYPDGTTQIGASAQGSGIFLSADSYFQGSRFAIWSTNSAFQGWFTATGAGRPVALNTFDVATATEAQLDDAQTSVNTLVTTANSWASGWMQQIGADQALASSMREDITRNTDRIDTAIGSLTDADLGKVSTARSQAETRQQLALQTIQQALTAYGNFAGSLLGNVQRTQRGVLA